MLFLGGFHRPFRHADVSALYRRHPQRHRAGSTLVPRSSADNQRKNSRRRGRHFRRSWLLGLRRHGNAAVAGSTPDNASNLLRN